MAVMEIVARVCSSLTCSCAQGVVECSRSQPHVRTLAILRGEQKGLYRLMVCARMQENRSEVVMAHPPLLLYSSLTSSFLRRADSQQQARFPILKQIL